MAAPVTEPAPENPREPSFEILGVLDRPWTAQMALDLLPENNGPKIEVLRGSVVVSPHAGYDHQAVERLLPYLLHQGEYRPIVAAAAGGVFSMTKPFTFEFDPAGLLDEDDGED